MNVEVPSAEEADASAARAMQDLDTDGNGKLDIEEFKLFTIMSLISIKSAQKPTEAEQ